MRFAARIAVLFRFLCSPVGARAMDVGIRLGCDAQQQVEWFVALFDRNAERAIHTVKVEANDPNACAVASTAHHAPA
jgi:hypothetical protein